MNTPRALSSVAVLVAARILLLVPLHAAPPDYKLGDVAAADVITPVRLVVPNPEATEELKRKMAPQVPYVVLRTAQSADDAEQALRQSVAAARAKFIAALRAMGPGQTGVAPDPKSPAVADAARAAADGVPDLPVDQLTPLWAAGSDDAPVVENLLRPLRQVMAQPIVDNKADNPLPAGQPVRLIPAKTADERPSAEDVENTGTTVSSGKVISLWRARRLVETYFPPEQAGLGRFAESFVRVNAYPDAALSAIVRERRMEGLAVNDTYEAAQVIVSKGETIDRKALRALAVLREKSLIGTLQTRLEQEQSLAGQIAGQTKWIAGGLIFVCLAMILILWRLRARPATPLEAIVETPALAGAEPKALPSGNSNEPWRDRALAAEGRAERAHEAIRSGALGWMRERVVQTLFHQRAELLSVQQRAEAEMRELEQRLEQLHIPLQERVLAYEKRIAELEKELAAKGEENRELIDARINVARQQLSLERERSGLAAN